MQFKKLIETVKLHVSYYSYLDCTFKCEYEEEILNFKINISDFTKYAEVDISYESLMLGLQDINYLYTILHRALLNTLQVFYNDTHSNVAANLKHDEKPKVVKYIVQSGRYYAGLSVHNVKEITPELLMHLYKVDPRECMVWNETVTDEKYKRLQLLVYKGEDPERYSLD